MNKRNTKGLFLIIFFRLSGYFTRTILLKIVGLPIRILYKIIVEWIMGVEIPDATHIGYGLKIFHGQGLVIHKDSIIGENVVLRQNTTIGNAKTSGGCPVIGKNVNIGANCVIIGQIKIGENSIIGAGSVVVKSFPNNSVIIGNPAKIYKTIEN